MKKLLIILALLLPVTVYAQFVIPLTATSSSSTTVSPVRLNGTNPSLTIDSITATSTTVSSFFAGNVIASTTITIGTTTTTYKQGINIPVQSTIATSTVGNETGIDMGKLSYNFFLGDGGNNISLVNGPLGCTTDPSINCLTNGMYNTFIGMSAGKNNTVGFSNTAIGALAGANLTIGAQDQFLGNLAGYGATSTFHSTFIGDGAGAGAGAGGLITPCNYCVYIGTDSGWLATSSVGSIGKNTHVGTSAGYDDNGNLNTSLGFAALQGGNGGNVGVQNVAIGSSALQNLQTGNTNVAVGYLAGNGITTGSNNTALGRGTLASGAGASSNVSIGFNDMSTAGGNRNTCIGVSSCTSVGASAGGNTDNTGIGLNALFQDDGGTNNNAIGLDTGFSISSGSNNTLIGNYAGWNLAAGGANGITNGANNTYIGYDAAPGVSSQLTNSAAIGYEALSNCSNCMILGGTGSNAVSVGIGTSSPAVRLHVSSGTSATTTVEFDARDTTSKSCFNIRNDSGAATSFYVHGTTLVVEAGYCK